MSGEDVKRILAAHGITQRELAASLGTSPQNIGSQLSKDYVTGKESVPHFTAQDGRRN